MRFSTLIAFSLLVACKSQPNAAGTTEPAVAPVPEEDEWNGFGGNDHPGDDVEQGQQSAEAPPEADRMSQVCTRMMSFRETDADASTTEQATTACKQELDRLLAVDSEAFEKITSCVLSVDSTTKAQECFASVGETASSKPSGDLQLRVCKKMAQLGEKEPDFPEEAKQELRNIDKCVAEASAERDNDPEKFDRIATCILGPSVSSMQGVIMCAVEG